MSSRVIMLTNDTMCHVPDLCLWVKLLLIFVGPSFSEAPNILLDYRETEFLHMARRLMTIASPITIMIWPLRDQNMALDGWLVKNCPFDRTDLQFYTSSATLIICQGRQETSLSPSARCRLLRNGFLNNFCLAISLTFKWLTGIDIRFFHVFQFKKGGGAMVSWGVIMGRTSRRSWSGQTMSPIFLPVWRRSDQGARRPASFHE